jgi:hypothetical protein
MGIRIMNKQENNPCEKWVEIDGVADRVTPDPEYIVSKDGIIYDVWKTDKIYTTSYSAVGVFRFVFNEDGEILSTQLPLFNFDNGFFMHSVESLKMEAERYEAYQDFSLCQQNCLEK